MPDLGNSREAQEQLHTYNVFIDTSIFRQKSFDLTNKSIKQLRQLGKEKK
jgi:hypothetical protein